MLYCRTSLDKTLAGPVAQAGRRAEVLRLKNVSSHRLGSKFDRAAGGGRKILRVDLTGDGGETWTEVG